MKSSEQASVVERRNGWDFQAVSHEKGATFVCLKCGEGLIFAGGFLINDVNAALKRHRSDHRRAAEKPAVQASVLSRSRGNAL